MNFKLWSKLIIAFIPSGIIGLTIYKVIKDLLLEIATLLYWHFLGGIMLIILEKYTKNKSHHLSNIEQISYNQAFLIGLCQSISIIPGVSRAGATIMGGLFLGLKRKLRLNSHFY